MEPNLHTQELFVIDRSAESLHNLKRGDVTVFSFDNSYYYVKRVIGLPGETLKISSDGVAVKGSDGNFQLLSEPYLPAKKYNYGDERIYIVPEGEYFMLGDNRDNSKDSRYFAYPYVALRYIYGKYIFP
jgi:signal peptidase I